MGVNVASPLELLNVPVAVGSPVLQVAVQSAPAATFTDSLLAASQGTRGIAAATLYTDGTVPSPVQPEQADQGQSLQPIAVAKSINGLVSAVLKAPATGSQKTPGSRNLHSIEKSVPSLGPTVAQLLPVPAPQEYSIPADRDVLTSQVALSPSRSESEPSLAGVASHSQTKPANAAPQITSPAPLSFAPQANGEPVAQPAIVDAPQAPVKLAASSFAVRGSSIPVLDGAGSGSVTASSKPLPSPIPIPAPASKDVSLPQSAVTTAVSPHLISVSAVAAPASQAAPTSKVEPETSSAVPAVEINHGPVENSFAPIAANQPAAGAAPLPAPPNPDVHQLPTHPTNQSAAPMGAPPATPTVSGSIKVDAPQAATAAVADTSPRSSPIPILPALPSITTATTSAAAGKAGNSAGSAKPHVAAAGDQPTLSTRTPVNATAGNQSEGNQSEGNQGQGNSSQPDQNLTPAAVPVSHGQEHAQPPSANVTVQSQPPAPSSPPAALHTTKAAPLPPPSDTPETPAAVNTARLIQTVNGSEMRVGMRSADFGNISISTSATRDAISAQISLDHTDLAKTLTAHIPEMQSSLGGSQRMEVRIDMNGQTAGQSSTGSQGMSASTGDSSTGHQHPGGHSTATYPARTTAEIMNVTATAAISHAEPSSGVRLDVTA